VAIESLPSCGAAVGDSEGAGEVGVAEADEGSGAGDDVPPGPGLDAAGLDAAGLGSPGLGSAGADDDAGGLADGDALGCAEAETWVIARYAAPATCNASTMRASLRMETSEKRGPMPREPPSRAGPATSVSASLSVLVVRPEGLR